MSLILVVGVILVATGSQSAVLHVPLDNLGSPENLGPTISLIEPVSLVRRSLDLTLDFEDLVGLKVPLLVVVIRERMLEYFPH